VATLSIKGQKNICGRYHKYVEMYIWSYANQAFIKINMAKNANSLKKILVEEFNIQDRLCGLVVGVLGYRSGGPG
jgi:hypothetical protein